MKKILPWHFIFPFDLNATTEIFSILWHNTCNDKTHQLLWVRVHVCTQTEIKSEERHGSPLENNNQFPPVFILWSHTMKNRRTCLKVSSHSIWTSPNMETGHGDVYIVMLHNLLLLGGLRLCSFSSWTPVCFSGMKGTHLPWMMFI